MEGLEFGDDWEMLMFSQPCSLANTPPAKSRVVRNDNAAESINFIFVRKRRLGICSVKIL